MGWGLNKKTWQSIGITVFYAHVIQKIEYHFQMWEYDVLTINHTDMSGKICHLDYIWTNPNLE